MRVLYDNQIFEMQKYGGISRYFVELFNTFEHDNQINFELPIRNSDNEYLKKTKLFKEKKIQSRLLPNIKGRRFLYKIIDFFDNNTNNNLIKKALKKQDFDIFHPTYYDSYFLKYIKNKPFVVTVYDMIHELFPQYYVSDKGLTVKRKKELINKADKIIAISKNTKKDIINLYGIDDEKIEVVYLASSLYFNQDKNYNINDYNLPNRYVLFVGPRDGYKNYSFFINSICAILKKDPDLNVVIVGPNFTEFEKNNLKNKGIENQVKRIAANDFDLSIIYKKALAFVFPSLYEGFGIPVLEAFSCECPVILSNRSSLPEIGGEAAVYFDPENKENFTRAVEEVVYDENTRKTLILKGRKRLKNFSWQKTAGNTKNIYISLLK